MSGVVRGVKKIFRKVGQVLKKVWKPLAIAAAVYFTAGAAMAYFAPATAAATAAGGASAAATAGGMMSAAGSAAAAAGATAAAGAATAATGMVGAASSMLGAASSAFSAASAAGIFSRTAMQVATGKGGASKVADAAITGPQTQTPTLMSRIGSAVKGMKGYERAMYVQTLVSGVSGLLTPKPPTPDEQARAGARFRGSYFGVDEKDRQTFDPVATYNEFFQPRQGESYRGVMPDRGTLGAPAAAAEPTGAAAATAAANQQRPGGRGGRQQQRNKTAPVSFIEEDTNASGNAGYYSPDDEYT